jgi:hypothetical protein
LIVWCVTGDIALSFKRLEAAETYRYLRILVSAESHI